MYPTGPVIINVRISSLPFVTLTWTSEDSLVAAGHDCQPILFSGSATSGWAAVGSLDDATAPRSAGGGGGGGTKGGAAAAPVGRLSSAAFNTFRNADSRGIGSGPGGSPIAGGAGGSGGVVGPGGETELMTVHQNTITSLRSYETKNGVVTKVSSSGVDGKLVVWDATSVGGNGTSLISKAGGAHLRY